jgi:folate-binding protein YgfZ
MSGNDSNGLASGKAFADLSSWRKIAVSGREALDWLNSLISADISDLPAGDARRSLLLSPTGRIRAAFTVAAREDEFLLLQDPVQPTSIGDVLSPYVLSADIGLQDRTGEISLFAFPGRSDLPQRPAEVSRPSCLGAGLDLFSPADLQDQLLQTLRRSFALASEGDVERWRVARGLPRFGVDALEDDLPQESGLDEAVAFDKGCYLGQEAVAKVRNLGHPRRLVLTLASPGPVQRGAMVLAEGREVGVVTSAVTDGGGSKVLARVKWEARDLSLRTSSGAPLASAARPAQPQPSSPV